MMDILKIASEFDIPSVPVNFSECCIGHINSTFFIECSDGVRYVLQKINTSIFKDPDVLMNNIFAVTSFIRQKLKRCGADYSRGTLHFFRTKAGDTYFRADDGMVWRLYRCIEGVTTLQFCDSPEVFGKVGSAFGTFQRRLSDFDASVLQETIPDFHNTAKRYKTFLASLAKDASGRAFNAGPEIDFVKRREHICSFIVDGIAAGRLPLRVTHNDTKLNNLLLDENTLEPVCVIDLDTVMPGSVLYDFGDAIRSGAAMQPEDSSDYAACGVNVDMFAAFAKGFISGLDGSLKDYEIRQFPVGAQIITFETGMRFLTDYLDGDVYFRTQYADHNLVRARNQFAMVADIERKMPQLNAIIESLL